MQRLEVSGAVRPIYGSLGVKRLIKKGKVIPLQARCGPESGYRYSSTLP